MRKTFLWLCSFLTLSAIQAQTISIESPATYLPDGINNVYFGMGIADFQTKRDTSKMERDISYGYLFTAFKETVGNNNVTSVHYKFDTPQGGKNSNRPLYELSIEFTDAAAADNFATTKFTSLYRLSEVADKEWFLSTNKDYFVLIRLKDNKVTIAAMMSGTEWGFD